MSEGVIRDTVIAPMPMDQGFKEIYTWLKYNKVSIIEENEPVFIKGYWNGKIRDSPGELLGTSNTKKNILYSTSSNDGAYISVRVNPIYDPFEKNIQVRIKQHINGSSIEFEISQVDPIHKGKGLLFWGSMLEEIYEKLGVNIKQESLENLYRAQVEKELGRLIRNYLFLLISSFVIVLVAFARGVVMLPLNPTLREIQLGHQWNIFIWYAVLVIILTIFFGTRYNVYYQIKQRLESVNR